jgi:hypothetical protein
MFTFNPMPDAADDLIWRSENVASLMVENQIHNRAALAKLLRVSRDTINAAFDDAWSGRATTKMIVRMTRHFSMPMAFLVIEPATVIERTKNRQKC